MSAPVLTFFNNKGGVGKTSLVYHMSWMFSQLGYKVVAIDLDPQANLTSAFLPEQKLEELWDAPSVQGNNTIYQCLEPLTDVGDIRAPATLSVAANLHLIPGDLGLASFEDFLSQEWPRALSTTSSRPFRILTAFWQIAQMAADAHCADVILADVGPNLGAINRSALIGSDHVAIPLAADLFSLQGLRNLGPTLRRWRDEWKDRTDRAPGLSFSLPRGRMRPSGYIVMQHSERLSRPVQAYKKWTDRIPSTYHSFVLGKAAKKALSIEDDAACLARLKHYRSLVPMALEARKPIFHLTAADGAIGSHLYAVRDAKDDFVALAEKLISVIKLPALEQ